MTAPDEPVIDISWLTACINGGEHPVNPRLTPARPSCTGYPQLPYLEMHHWLPRSVPRYAAAGKRNRVLFLAGYQVVLAVWKEEGYQWWLHQLLCQAAGTWHQHSITFKMYGPGKTGMNISFYLGTILD